MKAVVTGGTGFIGGKLVEALVGTGVDVNCLVRETSDKSQLEKLGVDLTYGDLGDSDSLRRLPAGSDVVFHLAALVSDWGKREDFIRYNIDSTRELLGASIESGVNKFVYLSSSTVVWQSDFWNIHDLDNIDETYPYRKHYNDSYNYSKAEAEKLVVKAANNSPMDTVVLRPSNVWGAGDTVILPRIVFAAKKGILYPMGSGDRWVSPCHITNLVSALTLAMSNAPAGGNIYFINDNNKIHHLEFLSRLLESAGIEWEPKISIPYKVAYAVASLLELLGRVRGSKTPPVLTRFAVAALAGSRSYSVEKAKNELGYKPVVTLDQGMDELGQWVADIGGVDALLSKI